MSPLLAILTVFAVLLLASVAVSWVHSRRAIDNFREIERRRLP